MAYSRAYIRSFARDASLTIDHGLYTTILLRDLSTTTVPEIPGMDLANVHERVVHENFKIPLAAARCLQSICYTSAQPETCRNESESQRPSRLELPLLKTDPEEDLYKFKCNRKCQQAQHLETLKATDVNSVDQSLLNTRTATIMDPCHNQEIERFSCVVPQAAGNLLKNIINTESISHAELRSPSVMEVLDPFYSDHPMTPFQESEQSSIRDSSIPRTSSVTTVDGEIGILEIIDIDHEQCLPGNTKDNPYIIDPLEDQFARISVTPEVEMPPVMPKGCKKLSSPLTPPNTIRSHRKNRGKDSKKTVQTNSLSIVQSTIPRSSDHGNTVNVSLLHDTRNVMKERVAIRQIHPSKVIQKIDLANLSREQVSGIESFVTDSKIRTSFKRNIQKTLESHRLPSLEIRDWAWAPWVPFQFNEDAFQSRFDVSLCGELAHSYETPQPIDPRKLLNFVKIGDESLEELEPLKLVPPWASVLPPRKRNLDSIYHPDDDEGHFPVNLAKTRIFDTLENSFPSMAFGLLANSSTQLKKNKIAASTSSMPANIRSEDRKFDTMHTLASSIELHPQDNFSSKDFQLIATSCGIMTRQAIRSVQRILRGVQTIERDFMASWISKDDIPGDADILLSPQAGIVLATIEEVQQQPLPGTTGISRFRRKIVTLASKFEKLYILVKTKNSSDHNILLESCNFMEHEGFVSNTVIHTENFEENQAKEALYLRIADLVVQEHVELSDLDLNEEETYWEHFLRKEIGVNAYAAQVVLQRSWAKTINGQEESASTLKYLNKDKCIQELSAILGEKSSKLLSVGLSRFEDARVDVLLNAYS